jgi:gliding motility-associated-like protein
LNGVYDSTGNWEEITNSGMLTGATWVPSNVPYGIYKFKYLVNGFCDDFDDAIITITLKEIPQTPIIDSNSFFCFNQPFQLNVNSNPNANFEWTGPNGFASNQQSFVLQNPTLSDEGLYTVKAILNGCESITSIALLGKPVPDFDILAKCFQNVYNVTVIPKPDSFDVANVTYLWTGPDNYSSTLNPINITGFRSGQYSVTVTNLGGCSLSKNVTINNTFCGTIPLGVSPNDDGYNETFDLIGLGAEIKFKIFNRYGTMVFEQDNYTNQWHGQDYNNHILPDATYFYYIQFKSGEEKTGWVYVTR